VWYRQALKNPELEVKLKDIFESYIGVTMQGDELEFVERGCQFGFEFRFRIGFPPRKSLQLDRQ